MIKTAGQAVLNRGGVLTDVTFYGEQPLAYEIRKTGTKFGRVTVSRSVLDFIFHWQICHAKL